MNRQQSHKLKWTNLCIRLQYTTQLHPVYLNFINESKNFINSPGKCFTWHANLTFLILFLFRKQQVYFANIVTTPGEWQVGVAQIFFLPRRNERSLRFCDSLVQPPGGLYLLTIIWAVLNVHDVHYCYSLFLVVSWSGDRSYVFILSDEAVNLQVFVQLTVIYVMVHYALTTLHYFVQKFGFCHTLWKKE